jgi:hypothetical protein
LQWISFVALARLSEQAHLFDLQKGYRSNSSCRSFGLPVDMRQKGFAFIHRLRVERQNIAFKKTSIRVRESGREQDFGPA